MWDPSDSTFEVDIFVREPFDFQAAYERRIEAPLGRAVAMVVSLEDLLELKREAGRPQDLADIAALTALHARDE